MQLKRNKTVQNKLEHRLHNSIYAGTTHNKQQQHTATKAQCTNNNNNNDKLFKQTTRSKIRVELRQEVHKINTRAKREIVKFDREITLAY